MSRKGHEKLGLNKYKDNRSVPVDNCNWLSFKQEIIARWLGSTLLVPNAFLNFEVWTR